MQKVVDEHLPEIKDAHAREYSFKGVKLGVPWGA